MDSKIQYRIADAHAHIYPEKIAEKATASVGDFYDIEMDSPTGTAEALIKSGSKIGVEKYLVCSVATKLEQVDSINNFISQSCLIHQEFIGLGAYHIDENNPIAAIDKVVSAGLRGIKIHPDFQKFDINDSRMLDVYNELVKQKLAILIHMGDKRYEFSDPEKLLDVLEQFPNLCVIASHFGGYSVWERAKKTFGDNIERFPNLYFDTSSSLAFLDWDMARSLVFTYGCDRMLFGVDFPMWTHEEELERLMSLGLSERDLPNILYNNFARLFEPSIESVKNGTDA